MLFLFRRFRNFDPPGELIDVQIDDINAEIVFSQIEIYRTINKSIARRINDNYFGSIYAIDTRINMHAHRNVNCCLFVGDILYNEICVQQTTAAEEKTKFISIIC